MLKTDIFAANSALKEEGPYYACMRATAVYHTMGGVTVDENNRVLTGIDGEVIPGLYAAG